MSEFTGAGERQNGHTSNEERLRALVIAFFAEHGDPNDSGERVAVRSIGSGAIDEVRDLAREAGIQGA